MNKIFLFFLLFEFRVLRKCNIFREMWYENLLLVIDLMGICVLLDVFFS